MMSYFTNISRSAILVFASALLLASCATRGTGDLLTELPSNIVIVPDLPKNSQTNLQIETIGPLDMISVNVFGAPDLSGTFQVDYMGKLKMPLINEIDAMGKTRRGLSNIIEGRLEESYLQNAEVDVLIKSAKNKTFTMDGSISKPGRYQIKEHTTLMEAIAMSGGVDEHANLNRIVIFREIEDKKYAAGFNLKRIRDGVNPDPRIEKNDIIIVDGSKFPEARREILQTVPLLTLLRFF